MPLRSRDIDAVNRKVMVVFSVGFRYVCLTWDEAREEEELISSLAATAGEALLNGRSSASDFVGAWVLGVGGVPLGEHA